MPNESPTISVATKNDDLVLDMTGNSGHRVPDRSHLSVDCYGGECQLLLVTITSTIRTIVDHLDYMIAKFPIEFPALRDTAKLLFKQVFCISPGKWQARDMRYVSTLDTSCIFVCRITGCSRITWIN